VLCVPLAAYLCAVCPTHSISKLCVPLTAYLCAVRHLQHICALCASCSISMLWAPLAAYLCFVRHSQHICASCATCNMFFMRLLQHIMLCAPLAACAHPRHMGYCSVYYLQKQPASPLKNYVVVGWDVAHPTETLTSTWTVYSYPPWSEDITSTQVRQSLVTIFAVHAEPQRKRSKRIKALAKINKRPTATSCSHAYNRSCFYIPQFSF